MKKRTVGILILISVLVYGCGKELSTDAYNAEIGLFKGESTVQFNGRVLGNTINWKFTNWKNGIGSYSETNVCSRDNRKVQQLNFAIYDTQSRDSIVALKVNSPLFTIDGSSDYKNVIFGIGKKSISSSTCSVFKGFEIQGSARKIDFSSSYGDQEFSTFEIVKAQEVIIDPSIPDYKRLRLWIVVSCNLYQSGGKKIGELKDGKFVGEIELDRYQ